VELPGKAEAEELRTDVAQHLVVLSLGAVRAVGRLPPWRSSDCVWDWSAWGPCDVTCGAGLSSRYVIVYTPAQHGGEPCPKVTLQKQACSAGPCASTLAPGGGGNSTAPLASSASPTPGPGPSSRSQVSTPEPSTPGSPSGPPAEASSKRKAAPIDGERVGWAWAVPFPPVWHIMLLGCTGSICSDRGGGSVVLWLCPGFRPGVVHIFPAQVGNSGFVPCDQSP
jgi:hypothetical protein